MQIELKQNSLLPTGNKRKRILVGILAAVLTSAAYAISRPAVKTVAIDSITFAQVKQGDMDIYTNTYGEFVSAQEQLLTAPALGKVAKILVRPGAQVTQDTVILALTNPQLEQQVNQAHGELAQQKAKHQAYQYEQQNDRLNYQGTIADIEANLEKAQLDLTVNQELKTLGAVSKLDLAKAKLAVKQQQKRLTFEKQKYQQFIEMQNFQLTQSKITVEQQASTVSLLEQQLADMQIKAGIDGTLQTLEVELGQSVQLGHSLAKVGSDKNLIARIRLPQIHADKINLNAKVVINSQQSKINGHISRIESLVTDGTVLAEVALDEAPPKNARPALTISAQVFVERKNGALYISQVSGLRPRTTQTVLVRNADNQLNRQSVTFGSLSYGTGSLGAGSHDSGSQNQLLITKGLSKDQQIVASDMSQYSQFDHIQLVH